jgi:hypothetical protein
MSNDFSFEKEQPFSINEKLETQKRLRLIDKAKVYRPY